MFSVIASFFNFLGEVVGGAFRLVGTFISSCFGLALGAIIVAALFVILALHLL